MAKAKYCQYIAHVYPQAFLPISDPHPGIVSLFHAQGWPITICPIATMVRDAPNGDASTAATATILAALGEHDELSWHSWAGAQPDHPELDDREGTATEVYERAVNSLKLLKTLGFPVKIPFRREITEGTTCLHPGTRDENGLPAPVPGELWHLLTGGMCTPTNGPNGQMTDGASVNSNSWDETGVALPDGMSTAGPPTTGPDGFYGLRLVVALGGDGDIAAWNTFMATLQASNGRLARGGMHDKGLANDCSDAFKANMISTLAAAVGTNPTTDEYGIVSGDGWLEIGTVQGFMARDYGRTFGAMVYADQAVKYQVGETKYLRVRFTEAVNTARGVLVVDRWLPGGTAVLTPVSATILPPGSRYVWFTYTGETGATLDWQWGTSQELYDPRNHAPLPIVDLAIQDVILPLVQSVRHFPDIGKLIIRLDHGLAGTAFPTAGLSGVLPTGRIANFKG